MFWDKYLDLCAKVGKSPSAVAKELGLSSGTVFNWKNGSTPRNHVLVKIAAYFDVPVESLLDGKSQKSVEEYATIASLMKAFEGLTDDEIKEVRHYIEFLKTKRE